jgi:hypothetical protein
MPEVYDANLLSGETSELPDVVGVLRRNDDEVRPT